MTHEQFEQAASYWTSRESDARRMPEDELRKELDGFLGAHNTCALATGYDGFVRCTPLEYAWRGGAFWIFSEGGLKFRALEHNTHVSLAVFEQYGGFGSLASAQVTGEAQVVDPASDEFAEAALARGLSAEALDKVKTSLHLIKVTPTRIDYLSSALKSRGYDVRQWIEL